MVDPHKILDLRDRRRVFAVGDIHGEFKMVEEELQKVDFDPAVDALVSVGDLVDRGPDSWAALEWIKKPWFHAVLGNHEVVPRKVIDRELSRSDALRWGADWYNQSTAKQIEDIANAFEILPVALTVFTPGGYSVGITHADCANDWHRQIALLTHDTTYVWATDACLESRETIRRLMKEQDAGQRWDPQSVTVANIDFVFHGHTVLGEPFTLGNRSWIDTGACYGHKLTLVDMDAWINHHKR